MGMFNEVYYTCPECGSGIIDQTKSGSCELKTFNQDAVPLDEVAGLDEDITCDNCGSNFDVLPNTRVVRLELRRRY